MYVIKLKTLVDQIVSTIWQFTEAKLPKDRHKPSSYWNPLMSFWVSLTYIACDEPRRVTATKWGYIVKRGKTRQQAPRVLVLGSRFTTPPARSRTKPQRTTAPKWGHGVKGLDRAMTGCHGIAREVPRSSDSKVWTFTASSMSKETWLQAVLTPRFGAPEVMDG